MIELFFVGTIISAYKYNALINKQYGEREDVKFDRMNYAIAHLHNIIWTMLIFVIIMYILMTTSMLLNYFEYEHNNHIIDDFINGHIFMKKFYEQFFTNIVKTISISTAIHLLFVFFLGLVSKFKRIETKEKAKFEFILSTIVSFLSIALIIIYVI